MKGLLYKNFADAWQVGRFYIVPIVALCVFVIMMGTDSMNNLIWLVYPLLLLSSLPFAALSVDEKCGWDSYYTTLPVTKAQRVSASYLVTLLLTSSGALLGALLLLRAGENAVDFLLFLLPPAALLFPTVALPFCFAQGGVKGATNARYFLILFVVGITVLQSTTRMNTRNSSLFDAIDFSPWLSLVVFAAIFALSWVISIKLYEKREI